jgi:hypothetical protein
MGYFSLLVSGLAAAISFYTFLQLKRQRAYADIDSLYLEVLKIGMQFPRFRDPEYTQNYQSCFEKGVELQRYEIYAYISWNIIETIYDKKEGEFFETWYPAIALENILHRRWFDNPENQAKYKEKFRGYIHNTFPVPSI